jgi:hypothetical protein
LYFLLANANNNFLTNSGDIAILPRMGGRTRMPRRVWKSASYRTVSGFRHAAGRRQFVGRTLWCDGGKPRASRPVCRDRLRGLAGHGADGGEVQGFCAEADGFRIHASTETNQKE